MHSTALIGKLHILEYNAAYMANWIYSDQNNGWWDWVNKMRPSQNGMRTSS